MKKCAIAVLCLFLLFSISACSSLEEKKTVVVKKDSYTMADFQNIIVGKSTLNDLSKEIYIGSVTQTSYGGVLQYPSESNQTIYVGLSNEDVVLFISIFPEDEPIDLM